MELRYFARPHVQYTRPYSPLYNSNTTQSKQPEVNLTLFLMENIRSFLHIPGFALHQAFIGFDPLSSSNPSQKYSTSAR